MAWPDYFKWAAGRADRAGSPGQTGEDVLT